MPLPASVNSGLSWSDGLQNNQGPFWASSAWWVVLLDKTNNHVEVWKSTDGGDTVAWAEVDALNHKSVNTTVNYRCAGATLDGTTIHIAYITTTAIDTTTLASGGFGGQVAYVPFDTTTGTWGAVITQTQANSRCYRDTTTGAAILAPVVRSGGGVVVAHSYAYYNMGAVNGAGISRIDTGAFVTAVQVSTATNLTFRGAVAGASDRVHVFAYVGQAWNRSFLFTNFASGSAAFHEATLVSTGAHGTGRPFVRPVGATTTLYHPVVDATLELDLMRAGSADALPDTSWTTVAITPTTVTNPEQSTAIPAAIAEDAAGILYVIWSDDTTNDLWYDKESAADTHTFGTATELVDLATVTGIGAGAHGTQGIGVLYADAGVVKFTGLNLATGPAATPVNVADTGTLTGTDEAPTLTASRTVADTGSATGVEARSLEASRTVADTGTATGADAATLTVSLTMADAGGLTGADAASVSESASVSRADTGTLAGAETATASATLSVADTGSATGADAATMAAALTVADVGTLTGVDAVSASASLTRADTGTLTGTDAASTSASLSVADAGIVAGVDTASVSTSTSVTANDTGALTGADAIASLTGSRSVADTGTASGADAVASVTASLTATDTGTATGADAATMAAATTVADAGALTGSDAATISVSLTVADIGSATGADAQSISTGGTPVSVADTGSISGTDVVASVVAAITRVDAGTLAGADAVASITSSTSAVDVGTVTGAEASSFAVTRSVADLATMTATEALDLVADLVAADAGTLTGVDTASGVAGASGAATGPILAVVSVPRITASVAVPDRTSSVTVPGGSAVVLVQRITSTVTVPHVVAIIEE